MATMGTIITPMSIFSPSAAGLCAACQAYYYCVIFNKTITLLLMRSNIPIIKSGYLFIF
jgi:hypothetical protein